MSSTRKELYDLANNYYVNAIVELLQRDPSFSIYQVTYGNQTYHFCIAKPGYDYAGNDQVYYFRNQSEKFARNLCWKKMIKPSLKQTE